MSGIDEVIDIKSCRCAEREKDWDNQYWKIFNEKRLIIGYFNPDKFRESYEDRQDILNPAKSIWDREKVISNPRGYLDDIREFRCNVCGDCIRRGDLEFSTKLRQIENFILGDVFPTLGAQ